MKQNLQELSDQQLLKEAKNAKNVLGVYLGMIMVMIVSGVVTTIKQGVNVFTFVPIAFFGIAMIFWSSYEKLRKEIKARNLK